MESTFDAALILRIVLSSLIGVASLLALAIEHWPTKRRAVEQNQPERRIPLFAQIGLLAILLTSAGAIWADIDATKQRAEDNATKQADMDRTLKELHELHDQQKATKGKADEIADVQCEKFEESIGAVDSVSGLLTLALEKIERLHGASERLLYPLRELEHRYNISYDLRACARPQVVAELITAIDSLHDDRTQMFFPEKRILDKEGVARLNRLQSVKDLLERTSFHVSYLNRDNGIYQIDYPITEQRIVHVAYIPDSALFVQISYPISRYWSRAKPNHVVDISNLNGHSPKIGFQTHDDCWTFDVAFFVRLNNGYKLAFYTKDTIAHLTWPVIESYENHLHNSGL